MKILIFFLILLLTTPSIADDKKQSLQEIEAKVEAEKAKQTETNQKMQSLQKDMAALKSNLIDTASEVQKNEKETGVLEQKLSELNIQKKDLTDKLDAERQSLAQLVTALERIRRLPPEALIARPGAPLETAQASIVLGAIMPELDKRAADYKNKLEELQSIENNLSDNREKLKDASETLKANKSHMEDLMTARQNAVKQTKSQYDDQQKTVTALSHKASDLKDLIAKIDEQERLAEQQKRKAAKQAPLETRKRKNRVDDSEVASTLASLGTARLPMAGTITIKYGQPDDLGAASEGLHIKAHAGSVVVSPMKGVVRYAGPFKSYGSIILIEHKNNYHSLIAGLGRIDTVVGQSVDAGEPLGTLGGSGGGSNGPTPSLYYELRFNGQPINPARKFADLG